MRARVLFSALLAVSLAAPLVACKKDKPPPQPGTTSVGGTINPQENAGDPSSPAYPGEPAEDHAHDLPETEAPRDNIDIPTGEQFVPGAPIAAPSAPPVDPLAGSIAAAKAGAVPCFATLPPGDWGATLVVTVTPTGTVTRSEVEAGNVQDDGVLGCLRAYAASLTFAPSEGRTVRIDVHVKG